MNSIKILEVFNKVHSLSLETKRLTDCTKQLSAKSEKLLAKAQKFINKR